MTNVTGFDHLLGQTNIFNMHSDNMSLGASNIMANASAIPNNQNIQDKEQNRESLGQSQLRVPTNEQNDISLGRSGPQSIAEIRNLLRKNIHELESTNQQMQQQLLLQNSFLVENNYEPSQMDLTRVVFGPDAAEISAINGRASNALAGRDRSSGGAHRRNASNVSRNALDESNFNCEVRDQDDSHLG